MSASERIAVFGYGSLVSSQSAAQTLGRREVGVLPAALRGWRRRFSQARDNRRCEKTFASADDGSVPAWILGLNLEPGGQEELVNGALIELDREELDRLDLREIRYRHRDVTEALEAPPETPAFDRVLTYVARSANFAPAPPTDAVILRSYVEAVEAAFAALGPGELDRYRAWTGPLPVAAIDAELVRDRIPPGNPREW